MTFDLGAYLDRIGFEDEAVADLATLRSLARCHTQSIAFENLDAFLQVGAPRLDLGSLQAKLVGSRRGGWCFEQNLLLRAALEAIGFTLTPLLARVVWRGSVDDDVARTHMLLRVEVEEGAHLIDVGFGGQVLTGVLELAEGVEQLTPHEPFRLGRRDHELTMETQVAGEWRAAYRFDLQPQLPLDYELPNWWLATHPDSHFRHGLTVARPAPGCRHVLANRRYGVHHLGGPSEKRLVSDAAELRALLADVFDIDAPPELDTAFDRLPVEQPV